MKKTIAKIMCLVVVATMMVASFASCGTNYTKDNTEFYIGATGPLTGDASSYGNSVNNGAMLAVKHINAAGGLNGIQFKFEMKDDKATAADAQNGFNTLYEAGMQVSLGSVTSGACEAFASRATEENVFFMTPSASAASVIADRANGFRVCFGDPDQGVLAAENIAANYETVGVIYDSSDDYSSGVYTAFAGKMQALNKTFTAKTFNSENKVDFSTQVEALKDCDVIFMPIYYTEAALIASEVARKGSDAVLFGCDGFDGIKEKLTADVTNKIMYITPFDVTSTATNVQSFVAAYTAEYGEAPDQFAADGYDAVMAIYEAMKNADVKDVTISATDLCEIVKTELTKAGFKFSGLTGEMTWSADGAPSKVPVIVELN